MTGHDKYLAPTKYLDYDRGSVLPVTRSLIEGMQSAHEKAATLFTFVRDTVKYNPYINFLDERVYLSSRIIETESTFCVPKGILLASMARAAGIPSRIRFADIRNHMMPDKMKELLKSDIIYGHGFAELYIDNRWLKATPAYDRGLCEAQGFVVTDFNGREDAGFPAFTLDGRKHIEYLDFSEPFDDFPFEWMTSYYLEKYEKFRELEAFLRSEAAKAP